MPRVELLEKAEFFRPDFPLAVQRVVNTRDVWNPGRRYRREFWKIAYLVDGRGDLILDDRRYPLRPGMVMLIHPRAATTYDIAGEGLDLYNLLFDPAFVAGDMPELHDNFRFFAIFSDDFVQAGRVGRYLFRATPAVRTLLCAMEREYDRRPANHRVMLKAQLLELLVLLLREGEKNLRARSPDQVVRYVDNVLDKRFRARIRLDWLAGQTGLSRFRLCRLYKERTGQTIIGALNGIRLDHAAGLLARSDRTVSEICHDAGYRDLAYFYRAFEKRFGVRPRAYREQRRGAAAG